MNKEYKAVVTIDKDGKETVKMVGVETKKEKKSTK